MKKYLKVSSLVISFQKRKFVVILNIFSFFYVTNNLSYFSMYQSMHLWKKNFFTLILLPGLLVPDVAINLKLFVRSRGVRRCQAVAAWLSIWVGVREGCRRDDWSEGTFEWGAKALYYVMKPAWKMRTLMINCANMYRWDHRFSDKARIYRNIFFKIVVKVKTSDFICKFVFYRN